MVDRVLFSSKSDSWQTPKWLYDKLNSIWKIDLDPCTTIDNPLNVPNIYTQRVSGLEHTWHGNVFVNPPYNREITKWLQKAIDELDKGNAKLVIFLLPVRTDTRWFHNYVYDDFIANFRRGVKHIWFIKGRLKFGNAKNTAPFPSMIVVLEKPTMKI